MVLEVTAINVDLNICSLPLQWIRVFVAEPPPLTSEVDIGPSSSTSY